MDLTWEVPGTALSKDWLVSDPFSSVFEQTSKGVQHLRGFFELVAGTILRRR
jgi:hypothetical protein